MTDPLIRQTLADALEKIVGSTVSSVTFVADYVQFSFNGPGLTAYTHPTVCLSAHTYSWGQVGYRDALCDLIGSRIDRTTVGKQAVSVTFENGATVSISLRDEDYCGPEALLFALDTKDRIWVV